MKKEIFLSLDTNILRNDPYFKKSYMDTFLKLCKKGKIQLGLSEIVVNEYKSQQYEELLNKTEELITRFETKKSKAKNMEEMSSLSNILKNLTGIKKDYIKSIDMRFEDFLDKSESEVHKISDGQASKVMSDYFGGFKPYKKRKSREDIPDSFIYNFYKEKVEMDEYKNYYFISRDEKLRQSITFISKNNVFSSIEEFIKSKEIEEHIYEIDIYMKDELKEYVTDNISLKETEITSLLESQLTKELPYKTINDSSINDDNNEGLITTIYGLSDKSINFNEIDFVNEGMFTIPFECEMEVGIEFYIYKQDYFCLDPDDQKYISISDHNDHYFEAEQEFNLRISGNVSGLLAEYTYEDEVDSIFEDIEFELESIESMDIE